MHPIQIPTQTLIIDKVLLVFVSLRIFQAPVSALCGRSLLIFVVIVLVIGVGVVVAHARGVGTICPRAGSARRETAGHPRELGVVVVI